MAKILMTSLTFLSAIQRLILVGFVSSLKINLPLLMTNALKEDHLRSSEKFYSEVRMNARYHLVTTTLCNCFCPAKHGNIIVATTMNSKNVEP